MSVRQLLETEPNFHNALIALGILSSPVMVSSLGLRDVTFQQYESSKDRGIFKDISTIGLVKKKIANQNWHAFAFDVRTISDGIPAIKAHIATEIEKAGKGLKVYAVTGPLYQEIQSSFNNQFARDASNFIDKYIRKTSGVKTLETGNPERVEIDKVIYRSFDLFYYPKKRILLGVGDNRDNFGAISDRLKTVRQIAAGKALEAQGGVIDLRFGKDSETFATKGGAVKVVSSGKSLKASNFKKLNKNNILTISYYLNGVLDIKTLVSGTTIKTSSSGDKLNLGHILGFQAELATDFYQELQRSLINDKTISDTEKERYLETITNLLSTASAEMDYKLQHSITGSGRYNHNITFLAAEPGQKNTVTGAETDKVIKSGLEAAFERSKGFQEYVGNFINSKGSESPFEEISRFFENGWVKGGKDGVNPGKFKATKNKPTKFKQKFVVEKSPIRFSKTAPIRGVVNIEADIDLLEEESTAAPDLQILIAVINENLEQQLKRNMGKGFAPKRLNYRTGRFARSAELKALLPTRGKTIEATITYLRNPYDVFLPGGRLHNELRDPEKLIGKSIRQILSEQFGVTSNIRTRLV